MGFLSALLVRLVGPWLTTVTIPALILAAVTLGHATWQKRDARILAEGERICDLKWEMQVRQEERRVAAEKAAAAEQLLASERQVTEGLRDELQRINTDMDALRAGNGADGRCLSDGVLDALKRRQAAGAAKAGRRQ